MALFKRGSTWHTYVSQKGIRYHKSTGTSNRRQAELIEHQYKEELNLRQHQLGTFNPEMTFAELTARFLSEGAKDWHRGRLTVLTPFFANFTITEINKPLTKKYRFWRHQQKKLTETTVNRDLQCLRHMLYWSVEQGFMAANPLGRLQLVREARKRRPVLSLEEEVTLIPFCSPHLQSIVMAALDTGMRRGELLNQKWEDIDFDRRLLFVTKSKTPQGEAREIPLTRRMLDLLLGIRQEHGQVFTYKGKPIRRLKTGWEAAIRRSGIKHYRFHDLRHTFNTRLMEAGVVREVRMALMGHSTGDDVHSIYLHIEVHLLREALYKLQEWTHLQQQKKGGTYGIADVSGGTAASPGTSSIH